jgi:hypothetical protein
MKLKYLYVMEIFLSYIGSFLIRNDELFRSIFMAMTLKSF